jgi:hypothetical protein
MPHARKRRGCQPLASFRNRAARARSVLMIWDCAVSDHEAPFAIGLRAGSSAGGSPRS